MKGYETKGQNRAWKRKNSLIIGDPDIFPVLSEPGEERARRR
jgi:hypothetical protein